MRKTETEDRRNTARPAGRWIRPVESVERGEGRETEDEERESGDFEHLLLTESRLRLAQLAVLEREVEERIRLRWQQSESEMEDREARSAREREDLLARLDAESREVKIQSQRDGRAEGFQEGFEKGKDEGRRLGIEQGRIEGSREGRASARHEETARLQHEVASAVRALSAAAKELDGARSRLLLEARKGVVSLAVGIARKVIKREVQLDPGTILGNVQDAVRQIFKGCSVKLQLHPDDARVVDEALGENPGWAEDLQGLEVKPAVDIDRGGCRLISGVGVVDMTVESQLELIEEALLGALVDVEPHSRLEEVTDEGEPT